MPEPELTREQTDRLVEALIDDVLAEVRDERRAVLDGRIEDVDRAQRALASAQQALDDARRIRADWQRRRGLDYSFGVRVVMYARLADFSSSAAPPGTHVRAVKSYFDRHPPRLDVTRLAPSAGRLRRLLRRR